MSNQMNTEQSNNTQPYEIIKQSKFEDYQIGTKVIINKTARKGYLNQIGTITEFKEKTINTIKDDSEFYHSVCKLTVEDLTPQWFNLKNVSIIKMSESENKKIEKKINKKIIMSNQMKSTTTKLICQAIKKDGNQCKYKAKCDSKYCGVHKNYIDTSKTLFTEEEEELLDAVPEYPNFEDTDEDEEEKEEEEPKKEEPKQELTADNAMLLASIKKITEQPKTDKLYNYKLNSPDGKIYKLENLPKAILTNKAIEEIRKQNDIISSTTEISLYIEGQEEKLSKFGYMTHTEIYYIIVEPNEELLKLIQIIKSKMEMPLLEFLYDNYRAHLRNEKIKNVADNHPENYIKSYQIYIEGNHYSKLDMIMSHCGSFGKHHYTDEIITELKVARDLTYQISCINNMGWDKMLIVVNTAIIESISEYNLDTFNDEHWRNYLGEDDDSKWD